MTKRPNLFIVGAPKCGTSAWVSYLSGHNDVFFSPAKEPHFFCEDFPQYRWAKSLEEYEKLFAGAKTEKIVGEASVRYLFSKVAAYNINAYNPDARILVFLRQQSNFLPSYHHQLLYNLDETIADFETAWRLSLGGGKREIPPTCREPAFLDYPNVGRFSEQLERYADLFPAENIKVIWFDDWTNDTRSTYTDILDFLELPDDGRTDFAVVNSAKYHRSQLIGDLTQREIAGGVRKTLCRRKD